MNILALECSAVSASAAIMRDGQLLSENFINNKLTHSATLLPMIEHTLKLSELSLDDISYMAVSYGPGSFTGIRIGINTVKGLCMGRNIPCVPVSTLLGLAYGVSFFSGIICPVMDARVKQVYNALFSCIDGKIERLCGDRALSILDLEEELIKNYKEKPIFLVGDGALLCYNSFKENKGIFLSPENLRHQRASGIAKAAEKLISEGKTVSQDELLPFYLRQAKIN